MDAGITVFGIYQTSIRKICLHVFFYAHLDIEKIWMVKKKKKQRNNLF